MSLSHVVLWCVLAFLLGVVATLQVTIVKNARAIRRGSETIRRRVERDNSRTGHTYRPRGGQR